MNKVAYTNGSSASLFNTLFSVFNLACIAVLGWLAMTINPDDFAPAIDLTPREILPCVMDQDGYLRGQLYGGLQAHLDWRGAAMLCDGMPRPEGQGIRLIFDEHADANQPGISMVIGLADAELGNPMTELTANVTIIDSVSGRFFSTQTQPRCWARLENQLQLTGTIIETWRVEGTLYCASALASLNDSSSVTLGDIEFSGVVKIE